MNCLIACLILWNLCFSAESIFFTSHSDAKLDSLRITYSTNKTDKWGYAKMPVTRKEAESAGFVQIGKSCSGLFQGYRYMKDNDTAVILLYDDHGSIAGIQTSFSENEIKSPIAKAWFKQHPMFTVEHLLVNKSDKFYTLTTYLVNPDIICAGEDKHQSTSKTAKSGLYYKNGTHNYKLPKIESELTNTNWVKVNCYPGMGLHYLYATRKDMNCDNFQPVFPLYLDHKLIGFGFIVFNYFNSPRYGLYEHPNKAAWAIFTKDVPDCINQIEDELGDGNLTTLHVYMIDKPWDIKC